MTSDLRFSWSAGNFSTKLWTYWYSRINFRVISSFSKTRINLHMLEKKLCFACAEECRISLRQLRTPDSVPFIPFLCAGGVRSSVKFKDNCFPCRNRTGFCNATLQPLRAAKISPSCSISAREWNYTCQNFVKYG